jgi:hypothetical protein
MGICFIQNISTLNWPGSICRSYCEKSFIVAGTGWRHNCALNNIFFDFNSYQLLEDESKIELGQRIVAFLKQNPPT